MTSTHSHPDWKDILKKPFEILTAFIGLVSAIVTFIQLIRKDLGLVAGVSAGVCIVAVTGLCIRIRSAKRITDVYPPVLVPVFSPTARLWALVGLVGIPAIVLGSGLGILLRGFLWTPAPTPSSLRTEMPLEVQYCYDFEDREDPTHIGPWGRTITTRLDELLISESPEYARSGTRSLRAKIEIQPADDFFGIKIVDPGDVDTTAASAWVLVPESELTKDRVLEAALLINGHDVDGEPLGYRSQRRQLIPGLWTPVFLGLPRQTEPDKWVLTGSLDELHVIVWCDKQYSGSIYFDDISFFTDARVGR
jgi:hypothetical protein